MSKYIKNNISSIIATFLLMQPFIDLLTGICIHTLNINFTLGIILRLMFLVFICITVLFIFKKKQVLLPYSLIFIYCIMYIIGTLIYKETNYFFEIQNLIKVFYFPILFISLYFIKDHVRISNMTLYTVIITYLVLIFIPTLFNVGYKTYEITKVGTIGFFNSANEISGILSILTPIIFIVLSESKKIIPIFLTSLIYLLVILMIGTKTPLISLCLTLFISLIYLWIKLFKNKKYKSIILSLILVTIFTIGLVLITPKTNFYKNIKTHLNYLHLNHITEVFKDEKLVDHFIFSSRLKFLSKKSNIYNKSNMYQKLFGIGYINNNKRTKMIEMDYFDIFYSHGFIGFLIFFIISIYILIKIIQKRKELNYENIMEHTSLFLILFLAFFTGHIIISPSVSMVCIILILSLSKRVKRDLLFTDKSMTIGGIETAQINLLNNINYNKYNVTLILEEKKGELLNKVNKNVIIKELKVSNNKNIFIRKITNYIRKLIYKIYNYHKYDFSCCYTTYSYSSNILAKISSINNAFYVHSDYKNVYHTNKEFREFFDSRKVEEYKYIIFVSNESKKSFIEYYPYLNKKTHVLNNFINIKEIKEKSKDKIDIKNKSKCLFVFVGRLDDSSKKLKRAINLCKELNINLWVIGDGPDRDMYYEYVKDNKLQDKVSFYGRQQNPYPYMKEADYIILTSDYEGFPVVYQEAIALNKPIITTINTSDDQLDMKDYAYIVSKDEKKMVSEVKVILNKNEKQKLIDLEKIQKQRIKEFEKLFNS